MLFSLSVPAGSERGPQYAAQAFAALAQGNRRCRPFVLEYTKYEGESGVFLRVPAVLKHVARQQLAAAYPEVTIRVLSEGALDPPAGAYSLRRSPKLKSFSVQPGAAFEDRLNRLTADPLAALLNAASDARLPATIALHVAPAASWQRWLAKMRFRHVDPSIWTQHLFLVRVRLSVAVPGRKKRQGQAVLKNLAAAFGPFTGPVRLGIFTRHLKRPPQRRRLRWMLTGALLTAEQLAQLWHPATQTARAHAMRKTLWRPLEPPPTLPAPRDPGVCPLGRVAFDQRHEEFGIGEARERHVAVLGKTGTGKSTLLLNMITSDLTAKRGLVVIDPHGDLIEAALQRIPRQRTGEVILFDAGDTANPVGFNPLDCPDSDQRPLVASGIVGTFMQVFGLDESKAPRLLHILRNSVLALLEVPGTTLLSVSQMLTDATFRTRIVGQVGDPVVQSFWQQEFGRWNDRFRHEAIAPVLNKLGALLTHPQLRAILDAPQSKLQLRSVLDRGDAILLCNLSKGRLGEDASRLLGTLLLTGLQQAALSRADILEQQRQPCYVYVDEAHNYSTPAMATTLAESRKYKLFYAGLANQYLGQYGEQVREAILGNVGTLIAFQVGHEAEMLAEELGAGLQADDLRQLPLYHAYIRTPVGGIPATFSMRTLPPRQTANDHERIASIRRTSHQRYAKRSKAAAA